jgi:hypothetical protein
MTQCPRALYEDSVGVISERAVRKPVAQNAKCRVICAATDVAARIAAGTPTTMGN